MVSSLKTTCYKMLIEKNLETQNLTILYDIVLKRYMNNFWKKKESVATQAQILRCLLVSKKLKEAWSLLGIQNKTKDSKVKQDVFENIANAIKTIGKSRKKDTSAARRIIQTTIISSSSRKKNI